VELNLIATPAALILDYMNKIGNGQDQGI